MNRSKPLKMLARTALLAAAAAITIGALESNLYSQDAKSGAAPVQTNSVAHQAGPPAAENSVSRPQLTGAELYSINCNRCHPERYPTERTAAQWKTIMLHMQVRANIPVSQALLILKYLQDNSGR
ncbi:MAG: hypothetical protein ACLQSR_05090 [Limisphaerales bacterium]